MAVEIGPMSAGAQPGMGTRSRPGLGPMQSDVFLDRDIQSLLGGLQPLQTKKKNAQRKTPSADDLDEIHLKAEGDVKFWSGRNERMKSHQTDVELEKPNVPADEDAVRLPDLLSILIKMTGMLSKLDENVDTRPRRPDLKDSAQALENAIRLIEEERESQYADGLHNPVKFAEFQFLLLRGWVVARVMFDSAAAAEWDGDPYNYFPWRLDLIDSVCVYPNAANKFTRVTHRYNTTIAELRNYSEFDLTSIEDMKDDESVECTGVYELNNRWDYHCVYISKGGERTWLKEPTAIGYMPWVFGLAGGFEFRDTPWQSDPDVYTKWMGVGILHALHLLQQYIDRYFSMLATMAGDTANPFTAIYSDHPEDEAPQEGLKRGSYKRFRKDTKIDRMTRHERGAEALVVPLITALQERQEKASIIRAMWGMAGEGETNSGFQTSFFIAVAHDVIMPYIRSWELFRQKLYSKILEIFSEYAPLDLPLMVLAPPDQQQESYTWKEFRPEDVTEQGTRIIVKLDPMTVQDKINLGQLSLQLVEKNIISRETARGQEFLRLKDPKLEDNKILAELIKLDPRVIEFLVGIAGAGTGEELQATIFNMMHAPSMQANMAQAQSGQAPMMPGQASSPAAQGQSQFDQQNERGRAVPRGGPAAGGVGGGGQPPPTPRTNQPY